MMASGGRIPVNARDYFRGNEKQIARLERRPVQMSPADLLGPGLAAQAVQIMDWGSTEALTNGYFYTAPGAIDTPDDTLSWTGQVIAKDDGTGMQQVWNTDGPQTQSFMRTYVTVYDSTLRTVVVEPFEQSTVPDTATMTAMLGDGSLTDGDILTGFVVSTSRDPAGTDAHGYLITPIPAEPIANPVLVLKVMLSAADPLFDTFLVDVIDEFGEVWETKEIGVAAVDVVEDLVVDFPEVSSYTDGSFMLRVWRGDLEESTVTGVSDVEIYEFLLQEETPDLTGNPEFSPWKRFATATGLVGLPELDPEVVDAMAEAGGPDGNPPATASVLTVFSGIKSLHFRWTEVPNVDPVTYRLHVRGNATPATDGTYEVASGVGLTFASVQNLTPGVVYHAIVTVEDADGRGPDSAEVTGVATFVTNIDVGDLTLTFRKFNTSTHSLY